MRAAVVDRSNETSAKTVTLVHTYGERRACEIADKRGGVVFVVWPLVGIMRFSTMRGEALSRTYAAWRLSDEDVRLFRRDAAKWRKIVADKNGCGS